MNKFYAGIGPRNTPIRTQEVMTNLAKQLSETTYWTLRSGHANGADRAFEKGAIRQQIFLPFDGYNGGYANHVNMAVRNVDQQQADIAIDHHPNWGACSEVAKLLLCRNVPILLGEHLDDPVEMIITWLPHDNYQGGTAHALRIASAWGIPVFNINKSEDQKGLIDFVNRMDQAMNTKELAA